MLLFRLVLTGISCSGETKEPRICVDLLSVIGICHRCIKGLAVVDDLENPLAGPDEHIIGNGKFIVGSIVKTTMWPKKQGQLIVVLFT